LGFAVFAEATGSGVHGKGGYSNLSSEGLNIDRVDEAIRLLQAIKEDSFLGRALRAAETINRLTKRKNRKKEPPK